MSREIKFRAWDKERGQMYSGDEIEGRDDLNPVLSYGELHIFRVTNGDYDELLPFQYTGLKDRNGKESYYKDIVEYDELKYVIEWDEDCTGFYLAWTRHLDIPSSEEHIIGSCIKDSVIIGNVFENPELLEG